MHAYQSAKELQESDEDSQKSEDGLLLKRKYQRSSIEARVQTRIYISMVST